MYTYKHILYKKEQREYPDLDPSTARLKVDLYVRLFSETTRDLTDKPLAIFDHFHQGKCL